MYACATKVKEGGKGRGITATSYYTVHALCIVVHQNYMNIVT